MIRKIYINIFILFLLLVSCGGGSGNGGSDNDGSVDGGDDSPWYDVTDFRLINSYNSATRLILLYPKTVSGDIVYTESATDLGISTVADFNNSTATKTTKTVVADDNIYDDYITSLSYATLKKIYFYVLYNGELRVFTGTTSVYGYREVTDSITGSTVMDVTITLPAGYDDDTSKTWPLVVSLKGSKFSGLACITICININWDSYSQFFNDLAAIKSFVNSAISGTYTVEGASLRINRDKIYGFGFSAGGCAVMIFANDDGSDLYEFNSVVGVGISDWVGEDYSDNLGDKNIWLFAGEDDTTYGPQTVDAFGFLPDGSGEHLLTEMPGVGHASNVVVSCPYMYMWLLSK